MNKVPHPYWREEYSWEQFEYEHRWKKGRLRIYSRAVHYENGKRKVTYLNKDKYLVESWWALEKKLLLMDHPPLRPFKKIKKGKGHQKTYPDIIRDQMIACGFTVKGSEIRYSWKRYLTIDCATVRFNLLSKQDQKLIGSPEQLLGISDLAYRKMKSNNRNGISCTYAECFQAELMEYLNT